MQNAAAGECVKVRARGLKNIIAVEVGTRDKLPPRLVHIEHQLTLNV